MSQEVCGTVQTVEETRLQKLYKNSAKHEDMRRRRTECSVELRKQKKDEALMKRRNIAPLDDVTDSEISGTEESILAAGEVKCTVGNITPSDICRILSSNPSLEEIRTCFTNLRRLLARDRNPPVREVIEANLLPALKAGIEFEDRTVQLEAAWAITNIVSGSSEDTASAVEAGIIPRLVQMCFLDDFDLAEQACWALANIAGDSATLRDICIREGIIDSLEYLVSRAEKLRVQFLRTIAWAYSNLCRHKNPQASIEHTSRLVKGIEVLLSNEDAVVRQDTCWALSYLTDGEDGYIRDANQGNVMAFVLKMLNSENDAAIKPAIRVLGNFATGSDDLTQVIIDVGTLKHLKHLLKTTRASSIVKETMWLLSNVLAGTHSQIDAVFSEDLLVNIVNVLKDGDSGSQSEAGWALSNLAVGGTTKQVMQIFKEGGLEAICSVLDTPNSELCSNLLDTLNNVLKIGKANDPMRFSNMLDRIEECGGLEKIEALQDHKSERIYKTAYHIIENFFDVAEEEKECRSEIDPVTDSQKFSF